MKFIASKIFFTKDHIQIGPISSNHCHECPFYDALNSWWHWNGDVMKHVSIFANEIEEIVGNLEPQIDFDLFQRMKVVKNQWKNLSPQMRLKIEKKTKA